jgi:hypothetical protein
MAGIETTQTFSNGDQVTATSLTNIIGNAKLNSSAVDSSTITVTGSGVLSVGAINEANINNNQVALGKVAQIAANTVLGNNTGSTANVTAVSTTDVSKAGFTPTTYAAEESVTMPNGLVMKFGRTAVTGTTSAITFGAAFGTSCISVQVTGEKTTDGVTASLDNFDASHFDVVHTNGTTHINWVALGY